MPQMRGYSSGKFALELEGKAAGFVKSVEGGEPFGAVVPEPPGADGVVKKHIGQVLFEPLVITFGVGMAKELYSWMSEVLNRQQRARSGAIVFLNYDFTEVERLEWRNGLITEVRFPALDGSSKEPVFFTITIAVEQTTMKASSGKAQSGFGSKSQKKASVSNFRFTVSGLESASTKVKRVSALTVTQPVVREERGIVHPGTLDVSNVLVTLPVASAQPWLDWVDDVLIDGKTDDASERTATLQLLDQTLKDALFTVTLSHVGPVRARRQVDAGELDAIAQVEVELYCESIAFAPAADVAGSAVSTTSTAQSSTTQASAGSSTATDAVLALLAAAGGIDATRALRVLQAGSLASSPELVAARLKATTTAAVPIASKQRKRADGEALGAKWASERATLEELQQMAALETKDWTSIQLPDEHTLVTELRQIGVVPPGGEGPLQLLRDEFVEGIVSGAARVFRAAQAHLGA